MTTEAKTERSVRSGSDIYLDVKVYGGTDISKACRDMVALADRMDITIWAELNGVRVLARPGDDGAALWQAWQDAVQSKASHPMAST